MESSYWTAAPMSVGSFIYNLKNKKVNKIKQRSLITVNLSDCKNWKECMKVMDSITSGRVKINVDKINK